MSFRRGGVLGWGVVGGSVFVGVVLVLFGGGRIFYLFVFCRFWIFGVFFLGCF